MEEQRVSGERQEAGVALSLAGKGLPELERNEKVIELKICWKRKDEEWKRWWRRLHGKQ